MWLAENRNASVTFKNSFIDERFCKEMSSWNIFILVSEKLRVQYVVENQVILFLKEADPT